MSKRDREALLDRGHPDLSIRRQCQLLSLCRSGVDQAKQPADDEDVALIGSTSSTPPTRFSALGALPRCCGRRAGPSTASGCSD